MNGVARTIKTMFAKIKIALAAGAAVVMAILYALLQKEKAERADEHAQIAEETQGTLRENAEAIAEGARRQNGILNEDIDTDSRDVLS